MFFLLRHRGRTSAQRDISFRIIPLFNSVIRCGTTEEKQQLFDALYDELPEGAEILFPKSGPGFYGTRGTVAGLQRLSKDSRFTPGTKGILQYLDKDGKTVRTYEGTSFIKTPKDIRYSLESDYKGKPVILSVPKTMRKADSDIVKMNEYHATNV